MRMFSLQGKLLLSVFISTLVGLAAGFTGSLLISSWLINLLIAIFFGLLACVVTISLFPRLLFQRIEALEGGLLNLMDGDYSATITRCGSDELDQVVDYYNQAVEQLRSERQTLYQRELLLDTVIQNSNLALVLTDSHERIVYANSQANQLFCNGEAVQGLYLQQVLAKAPEKFREMIAQGQDGLISITEKATPEVYYLSVGKFVLNTVEHTLYLVKQVTRELSRKEVEIWKRVIGIISHELNNSLAPISSMANSGKRLLDKGQTEKLAIVFDTIIERSLHLNQFIQDYSRLAKLPKPRMQEVVWTDLVERIYQQFPFSVVGELPESVAYFDVAQIEQALINLLKNAHESGSAEQDVALSIEINTLITIAVLDRGKGIGKDVMENILLPFYTTKVKGSGVGLPLCREIVEAHGGKLVVLQRDGGGVKATLVLPILN